ncbi:MAG: hypothetical protein IPJ27_24180 [Candidatus Accumulibacter sp.]|uniref:Uncharacterized protein n=1 Tax=Candidatus Accumulibacter proximus TaxID=2954385 RepID=A0A935Q4F2_9PROT|nr:hypothetical protein [Candidatus Accumulibacter proximus]
MAARQPGGRRRRRQRFARRRHLHGCRARRTAVRLLRLRHQLTITHRQQSRLLLCEETVTVVLPAVEPGGLLTGNAVRALLEA